MLLFRILLVWALCTLTTFFLLALSSPESYEWLCRKLRRSLTWIRSRIRRINFEKVGLIALSICVILALGLTAWARRGMPADCKYDSGIYECLRVAFAIFEGDSGDFRDHILGSSLVLANPVAAWIHTILAYGLPVCIPFFALTTVLSLLWNYLPHHISFFNSTWYIFSELDANSIRMSKSLSNDPEEKDKPSLYIFLRSPIGKVDPDTLAELRDINYQLYPKTEKELLRFRRRIRRELQFFFLSENTDENFNRMSDFLDTVRDKKLFRGTAPRELFLLSETESAPMLIDHLREKLYDDNDNRLPQFQSTELHLLDRFRATAYDLIRQKPFRDCISGDKLNILVLGFGKIGREFFRTACHMSVGHGFTTTFTLCDMDICAKSRRFLTQCPELQESARFHFRKLDAETDELEELVSTNEFHYILVALGDDERNIRVASRLKQHYRRQLWESLIPGGSTSDHPQICVNVEDAIKHAYTEKLALAKGHQGKALHVFGGLDQIFTPDVLMPRKYWETAQWIHKKLLGNPDSRDKLWTEYERRSSFACAANPRHHLGTPSDDDLCRTEHQRWMTFVRSEGMTYARRELMDAYFEKIHTHVDTLGKLSPCLEDDPQALTDLWNHLCALDKSYDRKPPFTQRDKTIVIHTDSIKEQTK